MLIPRYESLSVTIFASRLVDGEKVEDITVRRIFGGRLTRERCAKLDRNSKPRRFVWEGLHAVGLGGLSNWIEKGTTHGIQEFAHFGLLITVYRGLTSYARKQIKTTRGLLILVASLTTRNHKRIFLLCYYFAKEKNRAARTNDFWKMPGSQLKAQFPVRRHVKKCNAKPHRVKNTHPVILAQVFCRWICFDISTLTSGHTR
jgi:hypothetical protein